MVKLNVYPQVLKNRSQVLKDSRVINSLSTRLPLPIVD